jgi:hypothetical protein
LVPLPTILMPTWHAGGWEQTAKDERKKKNAERAQVGHHGLHPPARLLHTAKQP